ncbi:hypothetical protein BH18ACI4_BH18ACI4_26780 [soil metagenome]
MHRISRVSCFTIMLKLTPALRWPSLVYGVRRCIHATGTCPGPHREIPPWQIQRPHLLRPQQLLRSVVLPESLCQGAIFGRVIRHEPESALSCVWSPRGLRVSEDRVCGGKGGVSSALQRGALEVSAVRTCTGAAAGQSMATHPHRADRARRKWCW